MISREAIAELFGGANGGGRHLFAASGVMSAAIAHLTVMRASRTVFLAMGIGLGCLTAWLVTMWPRQPSPVPVASISLVSYTSITISQPDTNVFVYPGRGSWLEARMQLKNKGPTSISYGAWCDEPYGWATAQTPEGSTNGYLAPHFTGGTVVLPPGSNATFRVWLPPDTLDWQCGFSVATASVRERAFSRICQTRLWSPLWAWLLRLLPDKTGPELKVNSGPLVPVPWEHNQSLHSTPR